MNLRSLLLGIPFTVFALATARSAGQDGTISREELVRRTQELFDAVAPGNSEPWKKYYADDCIYFDEKGRNMTKAALVADITPLPTGYSGSIKITKAQSVIQGDTAILSYDLDETETIFGQNLTARYHQTDTWLRRNGTWQIAASQALRYYEDPAVGKVDPKKFVDLVGTYELAPGQTRTVSSDGGNLFVERKGKREQLLSEASEIFFRKGVEGRILFRHAENGKVDALIDRRNNEDVVWRKTSN
jgi:ketosteroid isomerase-like protein